MDMDGDSGFGDRNSLGSFGGARERAELAGRNRQQRFPADPVLAGWGADPGMTRRFEETLNECSLKISGLREQRLMAAVPEVDELVA
jgi:hypothetical protein